MIIRYTYLTTRPSISPTAIVTPQACVSTTWFWIYFTYFFFFFNYYAYYFTLARYYAKRILGVFDTHKSSRITTLGSPYFYRLRFASYFVVIHNIKRRQLVASVIISFEKSKLSYADRIQVNYSAKRDKLWVGYILNECWLFG